MLSFMDHRALNEKISSSQLKQLEKYLNNLFNDELGLGIDFTKHFEERVNDPRTKVAYGKDITIGELRDVFRDTARKFKSELSNLPKTANGHMINISNQLDIPFVIRQDRKTGELELAAKTVVKRKEDWIKRAKPQDGQKVYKTE